jgi:hypothetical protein
MTWRSRFLLTCGVVVATLALLVPSASAAPVSIADRKGDGHGPGDIRALRLSQAGSSFTVRLRTEKPLNLDVAPAWQNEGSRSLIRVVFDTRTSTPSADYALVIRNVAGFLDADLVSLIEATPRGGCVPVLTQPQHTRIEATFDFACLAGNGTVRAAARYRLDRGGDGSADSDDRAPNRGYTPKFTFPL